MVSSSTFNVVGVDGLILAAKYSTRATEVDSAIGTKVGWIGGLHMGIEYDYSDAAVRRQLDDVYDKLKDSVQFDSEDFLEDAPPIELEITGSLGAQGVYGGPRALG